MKKLLALAALFVAAPFVVADDTAKAEKTIVETAIANKQFSTLVTAVKEAGLVEALSEGEWTVFAPTNAAFKKVGEEKLAAVLKDKELLTAILTAHVVKGSSVMAADVVKLNGKKVKTAQGTEFTIKVDGDTVMIGDAKVVKTDIKCKNGVIHVIDTVLMPAK